MQDFQRILKSKDRGFRIQRKTKEREKERTSNSTIHKFSNRSKYYNKDRPSDDLEKPSLIKKLDGSRNRSKKPSFDKRNGEFKNGEKKKPLHPCRHCSQWHYDNECPNPKKNSLPSFYLIDQGHDSETEKESNPKGESEDSSDGSDGSDVVPDYHTTTNGYRRIASSMPIHLKDTSKIPIIENSKAPIIGTGISYLSAEPCPVRASLGGPPSDTNPLISGVCDSGGSCIIPRRNVPTNSVIIQAPLNPVSFEGIGGKSASTIGYIVIPTYFPNHAALSNDKRSAKILMLQIEYQVIEECKTGFLIGRDALKAYSINI